MIKLWQQPIEELDRLADRSLDVIAWCQPNVEEDIKHYTQIKNDRKADMEAYEDHANWICSEMWPVTALFEFHAAAMINLEHKRRDEHEQDLLQCINDKLTALDANYRLIGDTETVKFMNYTEHDYCDVLQIPDLRNIITSYLVCAYTN